MQREAGFDKMADRVGFEPTVSLHPRRFSSLPESLFADVSACFHWSISSAKSVACPSRCQTAFKRDPRSASKRDTLFGQYDAGVLTMDLRCVRRSEERRVGKEGVWRGWSRG